MGASIFASAIVAVLIVAVLVLVVTMERDARRLRRYDVARRATIDAARARGAAIAALERLEREAARGERAALDAARRAVEMAPREHFAAIVARMEDR